MKNKKIFKSTINIKNLEIGEGKQTLFIAEIASNFDGDLKRAKDLIYAAKDAGADVAKFQHYSAETLVSDYGFKKLGKISHQSKWKKSVYKIYDDASLNINWTKTLSKEARKFKIDFMTAPYDLEYVDRVNKFVKAYKIGSGDINWREIINKISNKKKPIIIATGASNMKEIIKTVNLIRKKNKKIILMQCNTNYTGSLDNFQYIQLNVL